MDGRGLDWGGCFNARDLGGLATVDGRETLAGALVRSDSPDRLTPDGWAAVLAHRIRTVVDLRFDEERAADTGARPAGLTTVSVPLSSPADPDFWASIDRDGLSSSPLFYREFLDRMPDRAAAAVAAVARAAPGGVLVHCTGGRDRTGVLTVLLLAAVGVRPADIAADNDLSTPRVRALFAARGWPDDTGRVRAALDRRHTTGPAEILRLLDGFDARAYLRSAGVPDADLATLQRRLVARPARHRPRLGVTE